MSSSTNHEWCESLYRKKAAELILYGRALGLSHCEAEDVLQETFKALLRLEASPEQPEYYCVRVFRNQASNYRRSLWRRVAREFEFSDWFETNNGQNPKEHAAMKSLEKLPVEQREVIVLKIWHEHTFEEISQITGVSPHTAAGRYRYGIQKLQTILKTLPEESYEILGDSIKQLDPASPLS